MGGGAVNSGTGRHEASRLEGEPALQPASPRVAGRRPCLLPLQLPGQVNRKGETTCTTSQKPSFEEQQTDFPKFLQKRESLYQEENVGIWFTLKRGPLCVVILTAPGGQEAGSCYCWPLLCQSQNADWVRGLPRRFGDWWVVQDFFPLWLSLIWAHHSRNQPSFLFHCVWVQWWLIPRGMFIPNWQELCIQGHILLTVGRANICMHDRLSLKPCICVHADMINAIMVQCSLGGHQGWVSVSIAIRWADSFEYLDLTMKMLAALLLPGKSLPRAVVLKHIEPPEGLVKTQISGLCSEFLIQ